MLKRPSYICCNVCYDSFIIYEVMKIQMSDRHKPVKMENRALSETCSHLYVRVCMHACICQNTEIHLYLGQYLYDC